MTEAPIRPQPTAVADSAVGIAPTGNRLPAATNLGRVRLQVADLERSRDWYEKVLGLHAVESAPGRASLTAEGSAAPLVELVERPGAAPVPRRGRLGLYHYALLLPDRPSLGAFLNHVASLGVQVGAGDHLVSEALYLQDPDGLGIEVYADRPREQWEVANREIRMDTLAVDAQDLLNAAAGTTWNGMPAGTKMGHVHLHIGDIEAADAFYHQGLGFDRVVWSYSGALFLSAGGYHHHVGLNTWAAASPQATEADARLLDWEIVLPSQAEVDAAVSNLRAAGYEVEQDGDAATSTDPWGITVRLIGPQE